MATRLGDQLIWFQPRLQNFVNVMVSSTLIEMMMVVVAWHVIRKSHLLGISLLSKVMVKLFTNRNLLIISAKA